MAVLDPETSCCILDVHVEPQPPRRVRGLRVVSINTALSWEEWVHGPMSASDLEQDFPVICSQSEPTVLLEGMVCHSSELLCTPVQSSALL